METDVFEIKCYHNDKEYVIRHELSGKVVFMGTKEKALRYVINAVSEAFEEAPLPETEQ